MPSAEKRRSRMIQSIRSSHWSRWPSHWSAHRPSRSAHWTTHWSRSAHRTHSRIRSSWSRSRSTHRRTTHVGRMGATSHASGATHGPRHYTGHNWTVSGMSNEVRTRTRPSVAEWSVWTTWKSGVSLRRMRSWGSSRTGTDTPRTRIGRAKRWRSTWWSVEMRTWTWNKKKNKITFNKNRNKRIFAFFFLFV